MSSDTSATGTNSHASETPGDIFVSDGTDYHLKASTNAVDGGQDLGTAYEVDIDGVARTGTWDIGCDQLVVEGGGGDPETGILTVNTGHWGGI